jgi:regulator of sigma E protease
MLTFVVVIIVFSVVILLHELGHFLVARKMGVKVERFSLGFGKVLLSKKVNDTEYAVSAFPFGGYVKMAGEDPSESHTGASWEFCAKAPGKRFWILIAGAGINYLFAFLVFCFIVPTSSVGIVLKDMPAYESGLQTNDRIVSIDGKPTKYWYEVLDIVSKNTQANPLIFKIERDKNIKEVIIAPKLIESKNIFGKKIKRPKVGIGYYGDVVLLRANPYECIKTGIRQTLDNTILTYRFIWYLITGKVSVKGTVTGPIGIAVILGKAVKIGMVYLIYLVGHINLALAVFNLLPFPVLDGGHILFLGLERIRKRPLNPKVQEVIQYIAIVCLVAFMLFVTYNDIFMLKFLK